MNEKNAQLNKGDTQTKGARIDDTFILLVRKASQGNRDALMDLCKTIGKGVLFRTTRILGNQTDAEDVTQEVMFSVCNHIHELREPKAFYVWLNRIIMNESNRFLMKRSKHGVLLNIEDYQEEFGEDDEDVIPQEYAIHEDDRKTVMNIIDRLPGQQRKAVLLHYYDGLTLAESAKVMNVSQPRVSRCLKFALEKIKKEISKQERASEGIALGGLALLPLEPLLAQVLHQEAALFTTEKIAWLEEMVTVSATVGGGAAATAAATGAATGAGVAGAAGGGSSASSGGLGAIMNPAGVIATVAAAAVVSVGVLIGAPALVQEPPDPPPVVSAEFEITFNGGAGAQEHVNPSSAVPHAYTPERGEMSATQWRITALGSDDVIYSGNGGSADDTLRQMKSRGETGDYVLSFDMLDNAGDSWTLSREFTIA